MTPTSDSTPAPEDDSAELYARFLAESRAGSRATFEELVAAHPHLAERLRARHERQRRVDAVMRRLGVVADESLDGGEGETRAWEEELLDRLVGRATPHQRYHVGESIGKGGMGEVMRVWDEDLERPLAMKVTRRAGKRACGSTGLARFLKEAQVTGRLDHPGIVPVHELGLDKHGRAYFTMKLVEGRELGVVFGLAREAREGWSLMRALSTLLRACEPVAYAHDRGVVHRDLKPSNVLVGEHGEVYVMDWGLARVLDERDVHDVRIAPGSDEERAPAADREPHSPLLTLDGHVVGTPAYMAPEQAAGRVEEIGPGADVYSLGAILYQLLTGEIPYLDGDEDSAPRAVLGRVLQGPPRPIAELAPGAPAELTSICEKAMARRAEDRYASATELARDLQAYLEGRVVRAHERGAFAELRKWVGRNRVFATALAGGVLAVGVAVALYFVLTQQASYTKEIEAQGVELQSKNVELLDRREALQAMNLELEQATENAKRERALAEEAQYVASIAAAEGVRSLFGSRERQLDLLGSCREPLRGWEWKHLASSAGGVVEGREKPFVRLDAHSKPARGVAVDPLCQWVATVGLDGDLRLHSFRPGESSERRQFWVSLKSIAVSPAGDRIAAGSVAGTIPIWVRDSRTPEHLLVTPDPRPPTPDVFSIAFSPDGTRLASVHQDGRLRLWDVERGEHLCTTHAHSPLAFTVCYHPDGSRIYTGGQDSMVGVWSAEDLTPLDRWRSGTGRDYAMALAVTPDGRRVIVGGSAGMLWVLESRTGEMLESVRAHSDMILDLSIDATGTRLLSASVDRNAHVWSLQPLERTATLRGPEEVVYGATFNPPGFGITTVHADGTVTRWDQEDVGPLVLEGHAWTVVSAEFSADGRYLATASDDETARVWDVELGCGVATLRGHRGRLEGVAWVPGERRVVTASVDGGVRLWNALSGETLRVLYQDEDRRGGNPVNDVVCDRHTGAVFFGSRKGALRRHDLGEGSSAELLATFEEKQGCHRLAITPAGDLLAVAHTEGFSFVDSSTGAVREPTSPLQPGITDLAFSPDGEMLAVLHMYGEVELRSVESGEVVGTLGGGHAGECHGICFDDSGDRLFTASHDRTIGVWDADRGDLLLRIHGHRSFVFGVAFDPVGQRLASTGDDLTVRLWETGLTEETARARRAESQREQRLRSFVDELFSKRVLAAEVLADIDDHDLEPDDRRTAERLILLRGDDPVWLVNEVEDAVLRADLDPPAYVLALARIRRALEARPDDDGLEALLGAALVRTGALEEAFEVLTDRLRPPGEVPGLEHLRASLFRALCLAELGRGEEARAALERYHELVGHSMWVTRQLRAELVEEVTARVEAR